MFCYGDRVMIVNTSYTGTVLGAEDNPNNSHPFYRVQVDVDDCRFSAVFTVRCDSLRRI